MNNYPYIPAHIIPPWEELPFDEEQYELEHALDDDDDGWEEKGDL